MPQIRTENFIDIGDVREPVGSASWCLAAFTRLRRLKRDGEAAVSNLKYDLAEFRGKEYFLKLCDKYGKSFDTWEDFLQYPEPFGLGMPVDVANAILQENDDRRLLKDVLAAHGGDRRSENFQSANGTLKRGTNSADYTLARLDRDLHTKLAAEVRAGTKSATAAAIEAGFRKRAFTIPDDPERAAKLLFRRWGPTGVEQLISSLHELMQ